MKNIQCLIVDDEPIARQIVEGYCAHFEELKIVTSCSDAWEARKVLEKNTIDLIFLDINMPVLDGMAFMKTIKNPPQVVFTTAYKEFAHEAFDIAACDYLLKPFSLDRFIMAIDRVKEKLLEQIPKSDEGQFIYIKSEGIIHKIILEELIYGEARGNNVLVVTDKQQLITTMTFTNFESLLPRSTFLKVHRSFIINKNQIDRIQGNRVFINSIEIPIGSKYKEYFLRGIGIKE